MQVERRWVARKSNKLNFMEKQKSNPGEKGKNYVILHCFKIKEDFVLSTNSWCDGTVGIEREGR